MELSGFDVIVVGSGFFGATIAERAASQLDLKVCVLDRRSHVGGNCFSEHDGATGIEYHKYGTHIFHTNSDDVWQYINKFTSFTNYVHKVYTVHNDALYSMPINLSTICNFFGRFLSPTEAKKILSTSDKIPPSSH